MGNTINQSAEGTEFVRYCIILEATQFSNLCYSFLYRKFEMNTTHSNLKECVLKGRDVCDCLSSYLCYRDNLDKITTICLYFHNWSLHWQPSSELWLPC